MDGVLEEEEKKKKKGRWDRKMAMEQRVGGGGNRHSVTPRHGKKCLRGLSGSPNLQKKGEEGGGGVTDESDLTPAAQQPRPRGHTRSVGSLNGN